MSYDADVQEIKRLDDLLERAERTHEPKDWAVYHKSLRIASGKYGIPFRPVIAPKLGRVS